MTTDEKFEELRRWMERKFDSLRRRIGQLTKRKRK